MPDLMFRDRATLILEKNGKILVVKHIFNFRFGLPGGGRKFGEKFEEAARREIFEELGISNCKMKFLFGLNFGLHRHKVFHARVNGEIKKNWEIREIRFVSRDELKNFNLNSYARKIIGKFLAK